MVLLALACVAILLTPIALPPTVLDIQSNPEDFEGDKITLTGKVIGSDPKGTLLLMGYEQPLSDRDFILHDGSGMIYVSTLMKILVNGETKYKEYIVLEGWEVKIIGVIELDIYGHPFLHATEKPIVLLS
jgi:hypothetical protein